MATFRRPTKVFAWECNVRGRNWSQIVNHSTRGKARYAYLMGVREAWPDVSFADVTVRKHGTAYTSEAFMRNARYRGLPNLRCGQSVVLVGGARGVVVGHNDAANFDVLMDEDSPLHAGAICNVHPTDLQPDPDAAGP